MRTAANRIRGWGLGLLRPGSEHPWPGESTDDGVKLLAARSLLYQMKSQGWPQRLRDAEFRVFSQFGDDGIIQSLIHRLNIPSARETFIEFGVEDYREANTRFLLVNDNWKGLILDGGDRGLERLRRSDLYWRHELTAVTAFIDRENINGLFERHGFGGEIGLLSIDIDGNDYWVWEAIDSVEPVITIVEYNSLFGPHAAVTVPYDPLFQRTAAHSSNLYWGCSLRALCLLAERKGLAFVGCNSSGNNAYFIRADHLERTGITPLSAAEGYVESRFRESRDQNGELTYLSGAARLDPIRHLPVVDVESNRMLTIGEVAGGRRYGD